MPRPVFACLSARSMQAMSMQRGPFAQRLARFAAANRGAVSMLFGLMCVVLFLAVGGAVDFGRWLHARTQTAAALDAAVLAAGRTLQVDRSDTNAAIETAKRFYRENTRTRLDLLEDTIDFVVVEDGNAVTANGAAYIETPFLKLAGIPKLQLLKLSGAEFSKAVLASGGNAQYNLEVALMLDITGSMAGQKLADMKAAAKDLVNIVVWKPGGTYTSRVALAPFSVGMNAGALTASIAASLPNAITVSGTVMKLTPDCVTERTGVQAFTDVAPSVAKLGRMYSTDGKCIPSSPIVPLTSDKTRLVAAIDAFAAKGSTSGHLGTAWAWYLLSPNWSSALPAESRPGAYGDLTATSASGQPKLRKIAVLMTDGEYNNQFCNGLPDKYSNSSPRGSCTAANGTSAIQARKLCESMKAAGITVYTIGFELGGQQTAIDTLQQCASDPTKFFDAGNGEELQQAFRTIAIQLSQLYLSQ
jgi:Flp pilus assembly protein TadG